MAGKSIIPHVISMIFFLLIGITMIVVYFVFLQRSTGVVEDNLKVSNFIVMNKLF